jgi:hypothetical protein
MSRDTPEGQTLTKFEALLDSYHRTLPLWKHARPEAIFATLAAFDMMMLPICMGVVGAGPNPHAVQKVKGFHDSLIYAMRFFWEESQNLVVRPLAERQLIEKAFDFLSHCDKFGTLVDLHVGFGRGQYALETDEVQKRVRFIHTPREGSAPEPAGILEDIPAEWGHLRRANEDPEIKPCLGGKAEGI